MKTVAIFIIILLSGTALFSQSSECDGSRFSDSLFNVQVTSDVLYGHNVNYDGTGRDLTMDIYEPVGDVASARPLIIFAPKGSFLSEDKAELTMVQLCTHFASLGYVAASIDYRVGVNYMSVLQDAEKEFTLAVLRAAHDYKAAIRFFRKDASTTNTYRVDTNIIIAGGSSAGAITALHVAYLDKFSEIPAGFDTTGLGGIEGNSGNPGYSSRPHYVVNLCGAIADTNWIEPGDMPLVSMHGNLDTEVPYGTATISMIIPIMEVDGSASIKQRADNIGVENPFYTFWGQQHIPYDENAGGSSLLYMDTVKNYITPVLYDWVCTATLAEKNSIETSDFELAPNPASGTLTIKKTFTGNIRFGFIIIINPEGQTVFCSGVSAGQSLYNQTVDLTNIPAGLYFVNITTDKGSQTKKLVVE